jgi:7,8-dihydropterin-6-yl-methyl-4-(beta-D-ribofuranosyl)aminobenzene 5'-phosphate synthase
MKTRISVLCENSVHRPFPFIGEHGLSFLIESDDATLFDTGQGLGILNNMKVMGKDPSGVGRIIISHGHYDHTGGMLAVLRARAESTQVYIHPSAFNEKLAIIPVGAERMEVAIGMRAPRDE